MSDPLQAIAQLSQLDAFNTATGAIGLGVSLIQWYQSEIKGKKQAVIEDYLEWLRRQNHLELLGAINSSAEELSKVQGLVSSIANASAANTKEVLNAIVLEGQTIQNRLDDLSQTISTKRNQHLFNAEQKKIDFNDFESEFLQKIKQEYGRVQMFGVRDMRDIKQEMNIAYVSLSVRCAKNNEEDNRSSKAEECILAMPSLTIRGPAGSGKSTLLSWIALQCSEVQKTNNPWVGGIPFFLPLRRLKKEEKGSPSINSLVDYSINTSLWALSPPPGWGHSILRAKRGVLLIDGVDELPAPDRPNFWNWLRQFQDVYPGNRVYITSRYFPEPGGGHDLLWDPPKEFIDAQLQEMSDQDIEILIRNWHDSVAAFMVDEPEEKVRLATARDALPNKLAEHHNRRVLELCRTPLLCSLVCTLHWREEGYLPSKRIELYDKCCTMLIEERDKKRAIPLPDSPLKQFDIADKEMILQRLAMAMMRNHISKSTKEHQLEISRQLAVDWIKPILPCCENQSIKTVPASEVLNYLIERTGLLREPSKDFIDFPHRSFQEYLSACAFGASNEVGDLVNHASDDQWHETIILSAGTKTGGIPFGKDLIQQLLDKADNVDCDPHLRQQCLALAVACLETARQVTPALKERAYGHLSEMVPPRDFIEARNISAAGESLLKYLTYSQWRQQSAEVVASCVHAIRLIGTSKAKGLLISNKGYCDDRRASVLAEILKFPKIKPLEIPKIVDYLKRDSQTNLPISVRDAIRVLEPVETIEFERFIRLIDFSFIKSIEPLTKLKFLEELQMLNCFSVENICDIALINSLKKLTISDFYIREQSFEFFSGCENLEHVTLSNPSDNVLLNSAIRAKKLRAVELINPTINIDIDVFNESEVTELNIASSSHFPDLKNLVKVLKFTVKAVGNRTLDGLVPRNAKVLDIQFCNGISDVPGIKGLESLTLFGCQGIKELPALRDLTSLKRLYLQSLPILNLDGIFNLESITSISIADCNQLTQLPALYKLRNLKTIRLRGQLFNIEDYRDDFRVSRLADDMYLLERYS